MTGNISGQAPDSPIRRLHREQIQGQDMTLREAVRAYTGVRDSIKEWLED